MVLPVRWHVLKRVLFDKMEDGKGLSSTEEQVRAERHTFYASQGNDEARDRDKTIAPHPSYHGRNRYCIPNLVLDDVHIYT